MYLNGMYGNTQLIKICLNGAYSKVQIGKHYSDTFSIQHCLKQGDDSLKFFLNFDWGYTISNFQENQQ
jgi:hypothetical protein